MTTIVCGYKDHQKLAHGVRDVARAEGEFTAYPWNRYDPEWGLWYLVPGTDWPAYARGKGFFINDPRDKKLNNRRLRCGLYVEKGFDPVVATFDAQARKKHHVMDSEWLAWPKLLRSMADGSLLEAANAVSQNAGLPVELRIESWYNTSRPEPGEGNSTSNNTPPSGGQLWWRLETDGALHKTEEHGLRDGLASAAASRSLAQLAQALQPSNELNWSWVDVYVGVSIGHRGQEGEEWRGDHIWKRLVRPWLPWII